MNSALEQMDVFPALRWRHTTGTAEPNVDGARRALWHAYQRGELTAAELASTLDRLDDTIESQWEMQESSATSRGLNSLEST